MELSIKDKLVLITGSSKGIAKAAAHQFVSEGCKVILSSRSEENLVNTSKEIFDIYGIKPYWIVADVSKKNDIANLFNNVKQKFGSVDILVNNVGGPKPGKFSEVDDDDWNHAFESLLMSVVRMNRLFLPDMIKKNWGRIINITSLSVKQPVDNLILSNSLRSAVTAMSKTLSNEVGKYNITVNNVAPGYTLTERLSELAHNRAQNIGESYENILAQMASEVPLKRLAKPEEIASIIVYLASEKAGFITGTTLLIDGGVVKSIS